MFTNIRTFKARFLGFKAALERHPMILPATQEFMQTKTPRVKLAVDCKFLSELWHGLCGTIDPQHAKTVIPNCVDWTMPPEYAAVIRRSAGVTTAFAYCEIAKVLKSVQDLNDDFEVRQAMIEGWKEFEKRRQEANNVQEGFGCDESQSWLTLRDINDVKDADELKQKMIAIAKLAGRMYEKFGYQRKDQPNDDPEEAIGATTGGDIDRVLPTELAMLGDPDTADVQAMKILQDRATITQMKGREAKTRGPLVLVIDESGSMHDGDNGWGVTRNKYAGRNTWAKAAAVALTRIAWSEDRAVVAVHFGNGTEVQPVPKDDHRALFEMARCFLGGGTNFGSALAQGREEVGDLAAQGHTGADIVLITDGEDHDHKAHTRQIDRMDADGIKLWTVAIGCDIRQDSPVRDRAERYTYASDDRLSNPNTATDLADGLNDAAMGNPPDYSLN